MMPGDDNGGVFIGFPDPQATRGGRSNAAHEIQIDATDADPTRTTGSVYSFQAPNSARDAALNPPGSWNTYEIGVHGQRVEIWLNGVKINDYTSTRAIANGYVGVQNDGAGVDINYRNIRVRQDGGTGVTDLAPRQAGDGVQCGAGQHPRRRERGRRQRRRPGGAARTPTRSGSPSTSARRAAIDRVRLNWETAYGRGVPDPDVAGQLHLDARSTPPRRATAASTSRPSTGTGRYVRVEGTQRATQWGYSLWDFAVLGA